MLSCSFFSATVTIQTWSASVHSICPLRNRRWDLLDLLLEWGADPKSVSVGDLFDSYNSKLFERFRELSVDLTAGHELAYALGYHTSNKPLFGYVKHHRDDPKIQKELDIALAHHAKEENEKGVQLCLWRAPTRMPLFRTSNIPA